MRERSSIDIFTPQNDVLGCRTKGFISWESTFTFILVDNSAFSSDEDYSVTIVNTPSFQKISIFKKNLLLTFTPDYHLCRPVFENFPQGFGNFN